MIWTALALGFLSSFHCVGMCGPIALAIGNSGSNQFLWNKIFYNLGRSFTYAFLGLIVGTLGFSLSLAGFQQGFSILIGLFLIFLSLLFRQSENISSLGILNDLVKWVKAQLSFFLKRGGALAFFGTGLANGLLPCGMVYLALVAALGFQSPIYGAIYMFFFGLGTMPLLMALMLSGKFLSMSKRIQFQRVIPYLGVIIGIVFIFRGLGLGIHLLSPDLQVFNYGSQQVEITMCR